MHGRRLLGHRVVCLVAVPLLGLAAAGPGKAQVSVPAPAPESVGNSGASPERVIGEVTATSPAARQITLKMDAGGTVTVILQDQTLYLRVPPGETDLKNAVKITPADIGVGDRVYARGRLAADRKSIPAVAVIVMTKAALAKRRERELGEWQKRGVAGSISTLNAETKEISLSVRSPAGTRTLIVQPSQETIFHRYAPDSVRFVQAKPSSFDELQVGDALRILGDKNANGTRITAEEIVSGSFRNIAGIVSGVDAAAGEIRMTDLQSRRPVSVRVTSDTVVRRMPPSKPAAPAKGPQAGSSSAASGATQGAAPAATATRPQGGGGGAASGGRSSEGPTQGAAPAAATTRPQGSGGGAASSETERGVGAPRVERGDRGAGAPGSNTTQGAAPAAATTRPQGSGRGTASGGQGAAGAGGLTDPERMPVLSLRELKRDEAIIVLCTVGAEPSRVTAIVVVAGIEPLLGPALQDQTQVVGPWNFFDISVP